MPVPESSLSRVGKKVREFLFTELEAHLHPIEVRVGNPADAAPAETDTKHRVNLFFYRVEPNPYGPAADPGETWRLKLCCLVTAFGVGDHEASAGENELRLLGNVLRAFHAKPILDAGTLPDETIDGRTIPGETVKLQVVFQPLTTDELNHLWMTQGEVAYRPSVAYEMSLVPVPPRQPKVDAPPVAEVDLEVLARLDHELPRRSP